jgi:hypothetical protein
MTSKIIGLHVLGGWLLALAHVEAAGILLIPEKRWTCDGTGACSIDDSPETVPAWKIELNSKAIYVCKRSGKDCEKFGEIEILHSVGDDLVFAQKKQWHGQIFKVDGQAGKFVTARLSGTGSKLSNIRGNLVSVPDLGEFKVINTAGTAVTLKP